MSYSLLIVESPEKAKTISKFLKEPEWKVVASKGHIRDLPDKEYGIVEEEQHFKGIYVPSHDSKKIIALIKDLGAKASRTFVATDDDREGERIAADLIECCHLKNYFRVTFSEISEKEVRTSLENPRSIDSKKLASQNARRLIDRVVGYPGSTALKNDFQNMDVPKTDDEASSIGRSIGPALRLLCQVEEDIQDYEENPPEPKKLIRVRLEKEGIQFVVKNEHSYGVDEIPQMDIDMNMLQRAKSVTVLDYQPNIVQKNPPKPLITSSFQFGCFYLFDLMPKVAMKYAQKLFECGVISYHRTDSCRVPLEKAIEIQNVIQSQFGDEYCHESPRLYQDAKSANAQNAHPAILPISFTKESYPKELQATWAKSSDTLELAADEMYYKIYEFIFLRAIASQMSPALFSHAKGMIEIAGTHFIAKEKKRTFEGWQKVGQNYQRAKKMK